MPGERQLPMPRSLILVFWGAEAAVPAVSMICRCSARSRSFRAWGCIVTASAPAGLAASMQGRRSVRHKIRFRRRLSGVWMWAEPVEGPQSLFD